MTSPRPECTCREPAIRQVNVKCGPTAPASRVSSPVAVPNGTDLQSAALRVSSNLKNFLGFFDGLAGRYLIWRMSRLGVKR